MSVCLSVCCSFCLYVCLSLYMYVFVKIAHNRAIRPCHPSRYIPLTLILPREDQYVCMYVCRAMYVMYVTLLVVADYIHTRIHNTHHVFFFLSSFVPENLASRDRFGSPAPRQPAHCPYSGWIWCCLRAPLLPRVIGSVFPRLSGRAIAYRWRLPPRVRPHRAGSPQGSSSNGCYLFRSPHGLLFMRPSCVGSYMG